MRYMLLALSTGILVVAFLPVVSSPFLSLRPVDLAMGALSGGTWSIARVLLGFVLLLAAISVAWVIGGEIRSRVRHQS
ncbi:MAG TPA: hypothetical protein VGQ76_09810 [Thermoanaerobaculia bacterium]|nr:hypothetical protein [Thermoanaerobaculia bacterium]